MKNLKFRVKLWLSKMRRIPPPFYSEKWYGVYDTFKEKVIMLYKEERTAANQCGKPCNKKHNNWIVVDVYCNYQKPPSRRPIIS